MRQSKSSVIYATAEEYFGVVATVCNPTIYGLRRPIRLIAWQWAGWACTLFRPCHQPPTATGFWFGTRIIKPLGALVLQPNQHAGVCHDCRQVVVGAVAIGVAHGVLYQVVNAVTQEHRIVDAFLIVALAVGGGTLGHA
jgi:hypothetical protein